MTIMAFLVRILSLALLAVASNAYKACNPVIPQTGQECPHNGQFLYPDTEHCSMYWECFDGCSYHRMCEGDFLFDIEHSWCDHPEKVTCGSRDCDGKPCKDNAGDDFVCPEAGYFADPENCIKYYHCYDDVAEHLTCPVEQDSQLQYNPDLVQCDWPERVDCGERPVCDENDENCVEDDGNVSTPGPEPTPDPDDDDDDDDDDEDDFECPGNGYYADPDNCIKYYHCFEDEKEHLTCDVVDNTQLQYNPDIVECDWPERVECGERPVCDQNDENCADDDDGASTPNPTPDDDDDDDFECPGNGYYADPDNCIKYYHCFEDEREHLTCQVEQGQQLLYDPSHNWCDYPENVDCGDRPICDEDDENCQDPDPEPTEDPNDDFVCTGDGYFADPDNCIKYYHCYHEMKEHLTCQVQSGQQLYWDTVHSWCDFPDNVNCGERPICDSNDENCVEATTPTPDGCAKYGPCQQEGAFMGEGDCEECFCECASGYWQEICCQPGLFFNEDNNQCDWPDNIDGC